MTFKNFLRRPVMLICFMLISIVSLVFSFHIRFGFDIPEVYKSQWLIIGGVFVLFKLPAHLLTLQFAHRMEALSHKDILKVLLFSLISSIIILGVNFLYFYYNQFNLFPNSVWLIDFVAFTNILILFQIIGWSVFNGFVQALKKNTNSSFSYFKSAIFTIKHLLFYDRKAENKIIEQLKRLEHI